MGLFRRRTEQPAQPVKPVQQKQGALELPPIELGEHRRTTAEFQWGLPSRCPNCGAYGYLDRIDLVDEVMFQHCPTCWHRWTISKAETEVHA